MGFTHHYGLIKEADDDKNEAQHITPTIIPSRTPWWKLLIWNFLAASLGAALMFLLSRGYFVPETRENVSTSAAAVVTPNVTIPSADLALTPPPPPASMGELSDGDLKLVVGDVKTPNMPAGLILDCGGNPAEAREKGCVYDVMMQDWVPVPCYDEVLTERYLAAGNWTWYADGEGKTTISNEDMAKGEHGAAWMSSSYHKAHCVFSWTKVVRALRNKRGISQELLSYDHVLHCSHGALKEEGSNVGLGVKAPTNYAKCALYETWEQDFIPDKHDSEQ